jgi:hypothetical protein
MRGNKGRATGGSMDKNKDGKLEADEWNVYL